jgi:hypothetical protein
MPNVKEMNMIYEVTPNDQPILLVAGHGCGKSESIRDFFEAKGYRVVALFLGQMSDAGDLLGLPDRTDVNEKGIFHRVTTFCSPMWWPRNPEEKVVLFLDELNRAKPETMQVIMDLVLNRKLADRSLPSSCRIIAAINPPGDIYNVEDMEPALLDRFNCYEFRPDVDEWIDWASKKKVHRHVIGFISRHHNLLDQPNSKDQRANEVYPSRRSWKRVSDIINKNSDLLNSPDSLLSTMLGIVGTTAVSAFGKDLREAEKGVHAGTIITKFHEQVEKIEMKLQSMNVQDIIALNREITSWLTENTENLKSGVSKETAAQYTYNIQRYLEAIPTEAMAEFMNLLAEDNKTKQWPKIVMVLNKKFADKMLEIMKGELNKPAKVV